MALDLRMTLQSEDPTAGAIHETMMIPSMKHCKATLVLAVFLEDQVVQADKTQKEQESPSSKTVLGVEAKGQLPPP